MSVSRGANQDSASSCTSGRLGNRAALASLLILLTTGVATNSAAQQAAVPNAAASAPGVPVEDTRAPTDPKVIAEATAAAEAGGTGPYKAAMLVEPTLPTHTVYRPRDLSRFGPADKLPIIVWGNGACVNYGNRFRYFLTEIASHGYFAVAIGPIGPRYLEGNPATTPPGAPVPPPQSERQPPATRASQLIDAMDWATAENGRKESPYYGKLDPSRIAVMGQSCGGLQAIVASADPRTKTTIVWNSGAFPESSPIIAGAEATKASLVKLHAPVAYISGDERDIAHVNANDDYERIRSIPAFRAYKKGIGHLGTYRTPNGGAFAEVGIAWLDWQLRGDMQAAKWFKGRECRLCTDPEWVVRKKNLD